MIEVVIIEPGPRSASRGQPWRYTVPGHGISAVSHVPLLDGCRRLLDAGVDPEAPVSMVWGDSDIVSMITTVGVAAGLSVSETQTGPRFHRYVPFDRILPSAAWAAILIPISRPRLFSE
jgi:hypothetical protein